MKMKSATRGNLFPSPAIASITAVGLGEREAATMGLHRVGSATTREARATTTITIITVPSKVKTTIANIPTTTAILIASHIITEGAMNIGRTDISIGTWVDRRREATESEEPILRKGPVSASPPAEGSSFRG